MARSVGMAIVRMARLVLGFVEEAFCQGLRLRRKEGWLARPKKGEEGSIN